MSDTCRAGLCAGEPVTCGAPACQERVCEPATGECPAATFLPNGTACDDGNPCTVDATCFYGVCQGRPRRCEAAECRSAGVCRPSTGACASTPVEDGTACSGGTCEAGECVPARVTRGCSSAGPGSLPTAAALVLLALLRRRPRRRAAATDATRLL